MSAEEEHLWPPVYEWVPRRQALSHRPLQGTGRYPTIERQSESCTKQSISVQDVSHVFPWKSYLRITNLSNYISTCLYLSGLSCIYPVHVYSSVDSEWLVNYNMYCRLLQEFGSVKWNVWVKPVWNERGHVKSPLWLQFPPFFIFTH